MSDPDIVQPPESATPPQKPLWRRMLPRLFALALAGVALYYLYPTLVDFLSQTKDLASVEWWWYGVMAVLMAGAFVAAWELTRACLPRVSLFLSGTSQLVSNALAKVIPGGAVAAGATYYQMLSVSGVPKGVAATGLAAGTFISQLVLFSLPAVALLIAAVTAPIPDGLLPVAIAGAVLFVLMFGVVFLLVRFDGILLFVGRIVARIVGWLAKRLTKDWTPTAQGWLDRRNEVVEALGTRWKKAIGAAALNWLLDYSVLVAALFAVGASPRPSLVLVAFAGSAVLGMIPITPGGLGFVEVGLSAMLVFAGVPGPNAALATLAYRLYQFWLPIPAGLVAYVLFKRRYGKPADLAESA